MLSTKEDFYKKCCYFAVPLILYFALFFNSYKSGLEIILVAAFLSLIDLKKLRNYNFVEQLFEGEEVERNLEGKIQKLKATFESNQIGLYEWDLNEEYLVVSSKAVEIYGLDKDKSSYSIEEIWQLLLEKDRDRVLMLFNEAKEKITSFHIEFRVAHSDRISWLEMKGSFFQKDSRVIPYLIGTVSDITESKSAKQWVDESSFKELADAVPQLIWVSNQSGDMEYYNQRWIEYTGVGLGMKARWDEVIHWEDAEPSEKVWRHSLATGSEFEVEYRLKSIDGTFKWFKTRGVPIRNDMGQIIRWFGTCTDIDELKKTQQKLNEALKTRDQFLSLASHEIRTPLTALRLQSDLLLFGLRNNNKKILSEENLKMLSVTTDKQVTRLTKIVDDLLDVSRIKLEKFSLDLKTCEITDIISECIERVFGCYQQSEIARPIFVYKEKVNLLVDQLRIEQVIQNLLTNAIRYGRKKPVEIFVTSESELIRIFVKDQGIGIDDCYKDNIFDLYYRAVGDEEENGLGLGLFIAKKIVDAHQGKISVKSALGEGSTFCVELPK